MPRNWSKAVPEGKGLVPQQKEFGSDQPTLADVYRELTPRRHNLYSDENHLRPATSLILPDRRDKFEEFKSIRLVLQHFLVDKHSASPPLDESH